MRNWFTKLTDRFHAFEDRLTVRTQIAAAVAATTILLVAALATGAAFISYKNTEVLVNSRLAAIAAATAERLDRYIVVRRQEILLISQLQLLQKVWRNDPVELRHSLEQLQSSFSDFAWIGFATPDGTVTASTGGLLQGASVLTRPWFQGGLQQVVIGDVHEAQLLSSLLAQRADGEPYRFVDIAVPVRDADGKLLGVLGAHLDWDWAREIVARVSTVNGQRETTMSIIDKRGKVLLGPAVDTIKFTGDALSHLLTTKAGKFQEMSEQGTMLTAYYIAKGYRDYQGLDWIITASQPASITLASAVQSARAILAIGAGAGLSGVVLAFLIARRIARPIRRITSEANQIGRASGPTMLPRSSGSMEVVELTQALRSLLRRIGFAEEKTREAELRASENAEQLKNDLSKLQHLADTDFLTGLMNRRAFLAVADDAIRYCRRYERPVAALMIDIDHFKQVNDVHGHSAGDSAIKQVAEIISKSIRETDKAARFGGEEFVVLLREVDSVMARLFAEQIRMSIEAAKIWRGETQIPLTVSVGVAIITKSDNDMQDMIERADQGLYVAKTTGRNRTFVMVASDDRGHRVA